MAETRTLRPDHMLIKHAIYSQAGSLTKALLELLMNAVDAAADYVDVTLSTTTFKVNDNGRGFVSREEIEQFFEVLGCEHNDDEHAQNRTYGRFGVGRAQCFAHGRINYRSATFSMTVDVENHGLDYRLETGLESMEGCVVTGALYTEMKPSEREHTLRDLTRMVKYMPIPVRIDGKQVNTPPSRCRWDAEDENAYYKFNESGDLKVFNQGAFVTEFGANRIGTGGVIVSKVPLMLNVARNDILITQCKVWPQITKKVREFAKQDIDTRKTRMNEAQRQFLAMRLADGEAKFSEYVREGFKIITDVTGRHHNLDFFNRWQPFAVAPKANHSVGEILQKNGIANVLSPITLHRFGVESAEELKELLSARLRAEGSELHSKFVAFEELAKHISDESRLVADKDLKPVEKAALTALRRANSMFPSLYRRATGEECGHRVLKAGVSQTRLAWTDGQSYVVIERSMLNLANKGFSGFTRIVNILCHEYCHSAADLESHGHDQRFYEKFESIATCTDSMNLGGIAEAAMRGHVAELKKAGQKLRQGTLRSLDAEHADEQAKQAVGLQALV